MTREGTDPDAPRRRGLLQPIRHYLLAVQFFTRIPVTGRLADWVGFSPAMLRVSAAHFPGVGWLVGALTAAVFGALLWLLPAQDASPWVAAALSTVFGVLLTGAFHEDGLADLADGLGGSLDRERALDIMKDSRIGSYGALALVLAVLGKTALLALITQSAGLWPAVAALFGAHVTSRFLPLFVIRTLPHVGDTAASKSKPLAEAISTAGLLVGMLWWALALALVLMVFPASPWAAALLGAVLGLGWMWRLLRRRLQGFTGDGLGATQQVCELMFYLGFALGLS
ncbi:adenosylcobinamide-GDP ribazoletransferase [Hydrogenophaga sp.]|uniref:adenosylcobinamide-GDP ribazoletransferase n=1 Tax=Hydrogenophaga sp. TaxID=1904254 RepID=UPI002601AE27|nr:adenosylcobinamide-GDP ribazoletransferase [Hydrogenophaga sp.]MDM7949765.1 adenosylcobinamide-GDP ribazoletransferase [Hydrogenophaga sp.]